MNIDKLIRSLELVHSGEIVDFNLADVVLNGQRLFRMGDVKRRDMPQLKGYPIRGSVADRHLEKDKNGKVDVTHEFLEWLKRVHGIRTVRGVWPAKQFSGSQCELLASKVAKHAFKIAQDSSHKKLAHLYISDAQGTLVDGHHGWGSIRVVEELLGKNFNLQAIQIMAHIDQILELARIYTAAVGVDTKEGV